MELQNILISALIVLLIFASPDLTRAQAAQTATIADHWDTLLRKYRRIEIRDDMTFVVLDYKALKDDAAWPKLLEMVESSAEPKEDEARKAYWINVYNILAVRMVLKKYPIKSILDLTLIPHGVWKEKAGKAGGAVKTLDEIEHKILRPMGDPRIHAAIVCASTSCPDLRDEAYRANRLDAQLDEQIQLFLASTRKGAVIEDEGKTLRVSKIFDWFKDDFGGSREEVVAYIRKHLPEATAARLAEDAKLEYLGYDWGLNDARAESK